MASVRLDLTHPQTDVFDDAARFRILVAGRRFGKTTLARAEIIAELGRPARNIAYIAPTYTMAKRLIWRPLVRILPPAFIAEKNVGELTIETVSGSRVTLFGSKNYDNIRGDGYDLVIFDELADIAREAWEEAARPALSDRRGRALFIGTPKGIGNWSYDLFTDAAQNAEWSRWQFTTLDGGWVESDEIEAARQDLDDRTLRQEYEATFEQYGGLVYDGYDDVASVRPMLFRVDAETWLCWDFNAGVRPMSVIVVQRIDGLFYATREFIYTNTNTEQMCCAIEAFFVEHGFVGKLHITGDNAGGRRESSASRSDYAIIEAHFRNRPGYEKSSRSVQAIQDRVNALNSLFRTSSGVRRLFIDPSLKGLRRGLSRVTWNDSGQKLEEVAIGETDPTDALSYFAYNYFPIRREVTVVHR